MLEKVFLVFLVVFPFAHNDLARAKKFAIPDAREQAVAERNIDAIAIERVLAILSADRMYGKKFQRELANV